MRKQGDTAEEEKKKALRSMAGLNVTQAFVPLLVRAARVPSASLTLGRCTVAALILLALARRKGLRAGPPRAKAAILTCGLLLAAHWALLFEAFRRTSIALTQVCCFTYPVMTSLMEPWLHKKAPRLPQVLAALAVLAGVAAMQKSHLSNIGGLAGAVMALSSAFLFSVRNLLTRWTVRHTNGVMVMGGQAGVAALALLPFAPGLRGATERDFLVMLALGSVTTAWPHTVMVKAMVHLPAAAVSILGTLQVPLSLILAWLLLGEKLDGWAFLGALMVLGAVVLEALSHWKQRA